MFNAYHVPDTLLGVIYTTVDKLDKAPGTFILVHLNQALNKGYFQTITSPKSNMDDFARIYIHIYIYIFIYSYIHIYIHIYVDI